MNSPEAFSLQHRNLVQQGYQGYNSAQLKQIDMGLRFTPAACALIAIYGAYTQNPAVLFFVAFLGMWAFFFPAGHPMDLFYNKVLCRIFNTETLPPNPFQRRLACFAAGIMNTTAAIFFIVGVPTAAFITIGLLMVLQSIVIFTHFCTLSWMYEKILRGLGLWDKPIDIEEAQKLLETGAILVDVRGPDEFAKGHIESAVNIPLDTIESQLAFFENKQVLLYCASGARSQIAKQKLNDKGIISVFNLGSKNRASSAF